MNYERTQVGYLIWVVLIVIMLLFTYIISKMDFDVYVLIMMVIIVLVLFSFSSLTVRINKDKLSVKFGYGIFKRSWLLKNIVSACIVKNHWYYGWGIRLWLWPYMWVYNVSGFDAVEIQTKQGKIIRIGTDEPKKLEKAILKRIK
jgi:hypothetical protein